MSIGHRVKQLRLSKGLTQQQLADLLGISYQNIGNLESGKIKRMPRYLTDLAAVFDVTVDFLQRGDAANYRQVDEVHDLVATDRPLNVDAGDVLYIVSIPSSVELILPSRARIQAKVVSKFIKS